MFRQDLDRRDFLRVLGLAAGALGLPGDSLGAGAGMGSGREGGKEGGRPNIVYILADDLGYGDVACQNAKSRIPTPHLDRLAGQGMRFTDAHAPSAVCTPTRYAVLTGRYCWRSRLRAGVLNGFDPPLIERGRMTVAQLLKEAGYETACIGKWHLGMDWPTRAGEKVGEGQSPKAGQIDYAQAIRNGPNAVGFDSFYGIAASLDMPPFIYIDNERTAGAATAVKTFVRRGPAAPDFEAADVLPTITTKAEEYIRQHAKEARPFFLYLALTAPHEPVVPTAEYKGKSQAGAYGDFVVETDDMVGRVVAAIDKAGIAENTLVIFTSDNGPERTAYARAEQFKHYSMGDWRGLKRDLWEGGHRVPFIVRWPGRVPAGTVSAESICLVDFFATAAAIVGAKAPANAAEDSYSVWPALQAEKLEKPIREAMVYHSGKGRLAIRQGSWVFIDAPTGDDNKEPEWFKKERGYQPHSFAGELYDLREDPAERKNLYDEKPEKVKELKALLEKYKTEGRSAPRT